MASESNCYINPQMTMQIITNGFWHNGIQFDNELEARWSIAFDGYEIKWCRCRWNDRNWLKDPTFWLPQVNMYACVYSHSPTKAEILDIQCFAESTKRPVLLLIGAPSNSAYFAIEPPADGFETELVIRGVQIYAGDYVPLDHGYHLSEGRFYFCSGEADCSMFPSPVPLGDDDNCYGIHAINAANNYVFPSTTGAPLPAIHPGAKDFGTWVLSGDELVLRTDETRAVDLESCVSSAQILDWIFHYRDRLTHQEMADLLQAFESILHPRQNYCGSGLDQSANPMELLNQWLNPKPQRKPIKPSVRFQILRRDGYRCQMCGATAKDGATLEIDHITPVSKGGGNDPDNLQVLCRDCNAGKSDQLL